MSTTEAPKIEFPCENYPIKVIGDSADDFTEMVVEVVRRHAPEFDEQCIRLNPSRNGTFVSVRLMIIATGHEQLKQLHQELMATGRVKMVL